MKNNLFWHFLILSIFFCNTHFLSSKSQRLITIMLDPTGDAKNSGRLIDDTFERGLTLPFTQQLKKRLEQEHKNVRFVLTRFPGETLEPLQNAIFSNTLGADFYITFLFFKQKSGPSTIFLYHLLHNPVTDFWNNNNWNKQKTKDPKLYPYNKAYLFNIHSSQSYGTMMHKELTSLAPIHHFNNKGLLGAPLSSLTGITCPSIALEIGLQEKNDWKRFIEPTAQALNPIINTLKINVGS